jgi:hypothetical protein
MGKLNDMQTQAYDKSVTITENGGGGKSVAVGYLKGLLNNVTVRGDIKVLQGWINNSKDGMVQLTDKQSKLYNHIKNGTPIRDRYHSKN